jgi:hypothetical protein
VSLSMQVRNRNSLIFTRLFCNLSETFHHCNLHRSHQDLRSYLLNLFLHHFYFDYFRGFYFKRRSIYLPKNYLSILTDPSIHQIINFEASHPWKKRRRYIKTK